jgi:hypothetical protein
VMTGVVGGDRDREHGGRRHKGERDALHTTSSRNRG